MRRYFPVFAVLAMSLMSGVIVPSVRASESDQKTIMTISQPIAVEGVILQAGQYILKLQDSSWNRAVVYIFNEDGTRLISAVLAIHAYRLQPPADSVFSFYESAGGQPPALHTWFYPGDNSGFEFLPRR